MLAAVVARHNELARAEKSYDKMIKSLNERGKTLMAMADYYHSSKSGELYKAECFRDARDLGILVSSTKIICDKNNATIINYQGSKITPSSRKKVTLPNSKDIKVIRDALKDKLGLRFLQTLFNTRDSPFDMETVLDHFADVTEMPIALPKPTEEGRKTYLSFFYYGSLFSGMSNRQLVCNYVPVDKNDPHGLPVEVIGRPAGIYRKRGN